jgi:hypothetical protein
MVGMPCPRSASCLLTLVRLAVGFAMTPGFIDFGQACVAQSEEARDSKSRKCGFESHHRHGRMDTGAPVRAAFGCSDRYR